MSEEQEHLTRARIAQLWCTAERSVQAFVFSAVASFQDAEDILQEVAMAVAKRYHEYDPTRSFVGWALWLAKSHVIDHYRRRGRERVMFSEALLDRIAEVMQRRQPERSSRQDALEHCIEKLPTRSRRLLDLRYVDDHSIDSIAKAIKSTSGSVRVMLFRVREVLARCIESQITSMERGT